MAEDFVHRLQVSESGFAFDPQTGSTFSLNHTGIRVLHLLRDGKNPEQIVESISRDYEVDPADALRDVEDFIHSLKEYTAA